mmetsp:Transcript_4624/g.11421  ORF Transcript_4624/g.11421 Transcript_4624/m.11421 type:complete len:221 (+) Transcript_4624:829-1491(+)
MVALVGGSLGLVAVAVTLTVLMTLGDFVVVVLAILILIVVVTSLALVTGSRGQLLDQDGVRQQRAVRLLEVLVKVGRVLEAEACHQLHQRQIVFADDPPVGHRVRTRLAETLLQLGLLERQVAQVVEHANACDHPPCGDRRHAQELETNLQRSVLTGHLGAGRTLALDGLHSLRVVGERLERRRRRLRLGDGRVAERLAHRLAAEAQCDLASLLLVVGRC